MLTTLKKTLVAGAVLAATAASAQALTVKFDQPNMGFGKGPIVVESTDGKTWSKINSSKLTLPFAVFIGHNSDDYKLKMINVRQGNKDLYYGTKADGYNNPITIQETANGSTDNFKTIAKMNLRDACNSRLEKPGDIHKDQNLFFKVPLKVHGKFYRDNGTSFIKSADGHVMVPVVCKGAPKGPSRTRQKITKVEFKAYAQAGGKCPKQSVLEVKVEGTLRGKVDFIIYNEDGVMITDTAPVNKKNTGDQAVYYRSWTVKKSETHKYLLALKGHKYSSSWKTVKIKCPKPPKPGANDKQAETRPNTAKPTPGTIVNKRPRVPTTLVYPVKPKRPTTRVGGLKTPPLVCIGGMVKLNNCYCKPTYKKLKIGAHAYRCVRVVTNKTLKRAKPARKQQVSAPAQQQNRPLLKLLKKTKKR